MVESGLAGGGQMIGSAFRDHCERPISGIEFAAIAVSLLEVVTEDLVPLDELMVLEPVGELLVELGARRLGSDSYAASRISRWRKRNASSSTKAEVSGRISSFRTSVERCDSTSDPTEAGASSATEPRWKTSPSTEPRSMTTRSSPPSASRRA